MQDIFTIFQNECYGIKKHKKTFLFILFIFVVIFIFIQENGSTSVFSFDLSILLLPSLLSSLFGIQIVADTIVKEKAENTLDVLISSGISELALLFGKILCTILISYSLSLLVMITLKVGFFISINDIHYITFSWYDFLIPLLGNYFSFSICIIVYLVMKDEKLAPILAVTSTGAILFVVFQTLYKLHIYNAFVLLAVGLLLCIMATFISVKLLQHSAYIDGG